MTSILPTSIQSMGSGCRLWPTTAFDGKRVGDKIVYFTETTSTQDVVVDLVTKTDFPIGSLAWADRQTAGRGRNNRVWESPAGKNLYFSFSVEMDPIHYLRLPLIVGQAIASAIKVYIHTPIQMKWPNDIYLQGKKAGGIKIEKKNGNAGQPFLVVGVGLNVNAEEEHFSPELRGRATSLKLEAGQDFEREEVLFELIRYFNEQISTSLTELGWIHTVRFANDHLFQKDREVSYTMDGKTKKGVAINLDKDGFLVIRDDRGQVDTVNGDDVNLIE